MNFQFALFTLLSLVASISYISCCSDCQLTDSESPSLLLPSQPGPLLNLREFKENITHLFYSDQCLEAYSLLDIFGTSLLLTALDEAVKENRITVGGGDVAEGCQELFLKDLQNDEIIKSLRAEREVIRDYIKQMQDLQGWEKFIEESNRKVYYKEEEGFELETFYIELIVDTYYLDIITFLLEVEHTGRWLPFMKVYHELGHQSTLRRALHYVGDAFWPLACRENIIEFNAFAVEEEKAVAAVFRTVKNKDWFGQEMPRTKGAVFMEFHKGFSLMKPINEKKTVFKFIFNVDPYLEYIPPFLMNFGLKRVIPFVLESFFENTKDLPEYLLEAREARQDMYGKLEEMADPFLQFNKEEYAKQKSQTQSNPRRPVRGKGRKSKQDL